jgi:hypothetical protein
MTQRPYFSRSQAWMLGALCVAVLSTPLNATAQKVKEGGKGKAGGPLLTRAQLRDCMAQQERMRSEADQTLALQGQFDRDKAEIGRLGALLKEDLAVLDRTSPEAVEQYNVKATARDKMIDDLEARAPAYNLRVQGLSAEREAYKSACENRRFDEKDEIEIKKGK